MKPTLTICCLLLQAFALRAADVSLAWDPSVSPGVTNYRIYRGNSSKNYSAYDHLGNGTTHTVTGLEPGAWYFAATALDAEGNESDYSNEVSTVIAEEFRITSMSASMRWFGVVLLCTTSDNASAILRYTDLQTGEKQTIMATPTATRTQHRAVLYLTMGQINYYKYEWTVTNAAGTVAVVEGTFQTK
jgi:large repetitive protein